MFGSYRSRASLGDQGVIGAGPTTQAVGEDGGGGKAPGIENSTTVITRALGEDASGGMLPGFGGNLATTTTMAMGEEDGSGGQGLCLVFYQIQWNQVRA